MQMVIDAIKFGEKKHKGQTRKVSGQAYITHPVAVSFIVAAHKTSKHLEEILAAAVLHDTLEDTDTTFAELVKRFSPLVASLVLELKNDPEEMRRVGKLRYQTKKMLGMSSYGLVIKLADRLHNISDHPTAKMLEDTQNLMSNLRAGRKLSKPHVTLVRKIEDICVAQKARKAIPVDDPSSNSKPAHPASP